MACTSRDFPSQSRYLARAVTRPFDAVWNPIVPKVPMVSRGRLIASPPVERRGLGAVALLLDPDTYVGDGELQVLGVHRRRGEHQCDGFVMTGSNLTNEKIAETLEFPRFFGRDDRI